MTTITREQAKDLRNAFEGWQQDYDPVEDKEQFEMFGLGVVAMDALLASLEAEPVAEIQISRGGYDKGEKIIDYYSEEIQHLTEGQKLYAAPPAPVVQCPFPCGWDNLNRLSIQDAAFVARGLVEGEPTTEAHRRAAISNNDRLLKVISACRAAMLQAGNSPVITDGCLWTYDDNDYKWDSACGESWTFIEDGPEENGVKFCQGCGKPVVIEVTQEEG